MKEMSEVGQEKRTRDQVIAELRDGLEFLRTKLKSTKLCGQLPELAKPVPRLITLFLIDLEVEMAGGLSTLVADHRAMWASEIAPQLGPLIPPHVAALVDEYFELSSPEERTRDQVMVDCERELSGFAKRVVNGEQKIWGMDVATICLPVESMSFMFRFAREVERRTEKRIPSSVFGEFWAKTIDPVPVLYDLLPHSVLQLVDEFRVLSKGEERASKSPNTTDLEGVKG